MTPTERAADTPKRCMQCRGAWAVGTVLINGRRQHRCQSCIDARRAIDKQQRRPA
jgi:hypothetical protein